jgi:hypothetical protein
MGPGDKSRGAVEQRLDVNEHGEETTRSGAVKRKRRVSISVADADSAIAKAN